MRNSIQQFILSLPLFCTWQKPSARIAQRTLRAASRKVKASGSNRSPVTAKGLCKQTGACAWLAASALLDSGTFFTCISRVGKKWNRESKDRKGSIKSTSRGQLLPKSKNAHQLRDWGEQTMRGEEKVHLGEQNWPKYVKGCSWYEGRIPTQELQEETKCWEQHRLKVFLSEFHHNSPI